MKTITEKQAIRLLRKYSPDEKSFKSVLNHTKKVQQLSLKLAKDIKADKNFIKTAALLHDIGRFRYHRRESVKHGVHGAKILRKEGFPRHALVAERHLGGGIPKQEAVKAGLPAKDYLPKSIEEKIITYADKLVFGNKIRKIEDALNRFEKEIGPDSADRIKRLHEEINRLKNGSIKIKEKSK